MARERLLLSLTAGCLVALGLTASAEAAPGRPDAAGQTPAPAAESSPTSSPVAAAPSSSPSLPEVTTVRAEGAGMTLEVHRFQLANGLRVHVVEDHSTPAFSMHTAFHVGSRDEPEGRTGFAHFFEHMMFKGSQNVPEMGHFRYVLGAGGELNAFTTSDVTQYYNILPSHHLELALWLESDRMRSLDIDAENFENQRAAIREERAMRYENVPYVAALTEFFADVWKGTGYGHLTIGSREDLEAARVEDVQAFFDRYYVPQNAVIAVVGDVDVQAVRELVVRYYGDIPAGAAREPTEDEIDHTQLTMQVRIEDPLAKQPLYVMGWKTVPEDHPDRHAVELLMNVLLRGESSEITRILVDEQRLALASVPLPSFMSAGRDAGSAFAAVLPNRGVAFGDIQAVVEEQIRKVRDEGISTKALQKAQNQLVVDTLASLATNNFRAMQVAQGALFHDDPTFVLSDLEKYQKVTIEEIQRVARQYLTDQVMTLEVAPAGAQPPAPAPATPSAATEPGSAPQPAR